MSRLVSLALSLLSLFSLPLRAAGRDQDTLTLAQALQEALAHNDRLADLHDAVEQADLSVHLARNVFAPKVVPNVQGSFGQTDVSNQTYRVDLSQRFSTGTEWRAGAGTTSAQIPSSQPGQPDIRFYNADTTLAVSQSLLRGVGRGIAQRGVRAAELHRADAGRQLTRAEQVLSIDVAAVYYRAVSGRTLVAVATNARDRSRKILESAEARLSAGLVSQLDVLRAQQLVVQAESQLADADAAVQDAHAELALLMGRSADTRFDVTTRIPRPPAPMPVEQAIQAALDHRPDLKSLEAGASDTRHALAFAKNQLLPQFDVNFLLTRRETARGFADSFRLGKFQAAAFFTISMPVDRTPQIVSYQQALIERDRRQRQVDYQRRAIANEVRRGARDRERLEHNLTAADAIIAIAQKEVEVANLRYEHGLSNNLDVVTAEGNLLAAESRKISVLAEAALSDLKFRALIGILDPRMDIGSAPPAASGLR